MIHLFVTRPLINHTVFYRTACLGVTESDWEILGKHALEALDLSIAKKAYTRLKDLKYLEMIADLEQRKSRDEEQVLLADIAGNGTFYRHVTQPQ